MGYMSTHSMRRADLSRNYPVEVRLRELIVEVETIGASVDLSKCVISLLQAQSHLADYYDNCPTPANGSKKL